MTALKSILVVLLLTLAAACSTNRATQTEAAPGADATITVREPQVMRLASGGTGQGTLILGGWQYPFEISNMVLSGVGAGDIQLEGDVYNLEEASDFEGTYKLLAAEVKAGEGVQGFWFENDKGVRVHIRAEGQDVTIRTGSGGSVVTLKEE